MLRTRLTLGLVCLLIILLSMGLYSINQCSELGQRIEAISRDNDVVGVNLQRMKRSCTEMTGALLTLVTSDQSLSQKDFIKASARFQEALQNEQLRENASPEEKKIITSLSLTYDLYQKRAYAFLHAPYQSDVNGRAAANKLGQETSQIMDMVDRLTLAHEKGIRANRQDAHNDVVNTIRSLFLLMLTAATCAIYASLRLSRGLLEPLSSLTTSIRQIGEGKLDQVVPVLSKDEIGMLATSFNEMAAQLRQYKTNTAEELMRLTKTIRATLASFPDPIFVLDSKGIIEVRNPEADQLAMKLLFSGVNRLPQQVEAKVEQVLTTGQDYLPTLFKDAIKLQFKNQDHYFLPRIVLLRDEGKDAFGVAVILENITKMLLLDDIKSNLIATVSHELKTPLTSVRMVLYLLDEKAVGPLNPKQTDLVSTAKQDADRLLKTLNDLLDLAKLEQGPTQLELISVNPADLIESVVYETRELARSANIHVKTEIGEKLPNILIDRQRIDYVLANLLTNAVKYSPQGSEIIIQAFLGKKKNLQEGIYISVKDQGEGISPEHQEHIFKRFYRVPGTTKTGAGLGLSIAREIVLMHQGEIGVISEVSKGSEFYFILPLVRND